MKNQTTSEKITAALAARNGVLPRNSTEAIGFIQDCLEVDASGWAVDYNYAVGCYIATPRRAQQRNPKFRREIGRWLFTFLKLRGLSTGDAISHIPHYIHKRDYCPVRAEQFTTVEERARARKLTPVGRGYRTAIGVEIEGFSKHEHEKLTALLPIYSKVVHDGSIRATGTDVAAEVVSLLNRDEMEPRLHRMCERLAKAGFSTNKSCGLHIHIDCRNLSFEEVCKRAKVMDKWIAALVELVPLSRRDNSYCRLGFSRTDRYRAVNLQSYSKHSTLEIRIHSATSSYQKILAWIRLCELLFSLKKAPKAGAGCLSTLEQLPLAEYERSYWKSRHIQLNPAQYLGAAIVSNGGEE